MIDQDISIVLRSIYKLYIHCIDIFLVPVRLYDWKCFFSAALVLVNYSLNHIIQSRNQNSYIKTLNKISNNMDMADEDFTTKGGVEK